MFAGPFAPQGWALCDGQLLAVSQNDALFSLLGTIYGGDGRTTFGLPDLRGRIPVHAGAGPGLAAVALGARAGQETVTVTENQMPVHTHGAVATSNPASDRSGAGALLSQSTVRNFISNPPPIPPPVDMNAAAIGMVGGGQSHNNLQPFLAVNFIIALFGIYPARN